MKHTYIKSAYFLTNRPNIYASKGATSGTAYFGAELIMGAMDSEYQFQENANASPNSVGKVHGNGTSIISLLDIPFQIELENFTDQEKDTTIYFGFHAYVGAASSAKHQAYARLNCTDTADVDYCCYCTVRHHYLNNDYQTYTTKTEYIFAEIGKDFTPETRPEGYADITPQTKFITGTTEEFDYYYNDKITITDHRWINYNEQDFIRTISYSQFTTEKVAGVEPFPNVNIESEMERGDWLVASQPTPSNKTVTCDYFSIHTCAHIPAHAKLTRALDMSIAIQKPIRGDGTAGVAAYLESFGTKKPDLSERSFNLSNTTATDSLLSVCSGVNYSTTNPISNTNTFVFSLDNQSDTYRIDTLYWGFIGHCAYAKSAKRTILATIHCNSVINELNYYYRCHYCLRQEDGLFKEIDTPQWSTEAVPLGTIITPKEYDNYVTPPAQEVQLTNGVAELYFYYESSIPQGVDISACVDNFGDYGITFNFNTFTYGEEGIAPNIDNLYAVVHGGDRQKITPHVDTYTGKKDKTIVVPFTSTFTAGDSIRISIYEETANGVTILSGRNYLYPYINTIPTTTADNDLYVSDGTSLTLSSDVTINNVYIGAGCELIIAPGVTLTVKGDVQVAYRNGEAGQLTNYGTLKVASGKYMLAYQVATKDRYFALSLPFECQLPEVNTEYYIPMSTGQKAKVSKQVQIKLFDGIVRSQQGKEHAWQPVTTGLLPANQGFEILSGSAYYRKYLFPMTYTKEAPSSLPVKYEESAEEYNAGWNLLGNPFTSTFTGRVSLDESDTYVTMYNQDGTYFQELGNNLTIPPHTPFYVQTSKDAEVVFTSAQELAPRRATYNEQDVWIPITLTHAKGNDKTTLRIADRYTASYEVGADLEKMLGYAERPQLYSIADKIPLVFNALSFTDAEQAIPLGYYAPQTTTMCFNQLNLSNQKSVWLYDQLTGVFTDLTQSSYSFDTEQGTNNTRFLIYVTDNELPTTTKIVPQSSSNVRKRIINGHLYIEYDNTMYNANGVQIIK